MHFNLIKLAQQIDDNNKAGMKSVGAGLAAAGVGLGANYMANRMMTNMPAMPNVSMPAPIPTMEQHFGGNVPNWDKLQKIKNLSQQEYDNARDATAKAAFKERLDKVNKQFEQKNAYEDMQRAHEQAKQQAQQTQAKHTRQVARTTQNASRLKALGLAGAGALGLYAGYQGIQALRNRSNNANGQPSTAV